MATEMSAPPVLSTPDNHILNEIEPVAIVEPSQRLSDEQITVRYEIERTVREIKQNKWKRVALQFPDQMLPDSVRVYQLLARGLKVQGGRHGDAVAATIRNTSETCLNDEMQSLAIHEQEKPVKLTILGDTSYGSCCVDEIAAEHVDADVVVHYGRSCLSPTARLPVMYIFTTRDLDHRAVCKAFENIFSQRDAKIILSADTPYSQHIETLAETLKQLGYSNVFTASIIHDPSSLIPNRTVPDTVSQDSSKLKDWNLFHISDPPTSLLLTLSSRMKSVHIYPTTSEGSADATPRQANSSIILRRRYALITSLGTVSTWGILINTLSVKNYLHIVEYVKKQIADAGKKSYLFVVGKLNAAKVANFAEIGGWVVIGCWESSLVDNRDFFSPIITPFELDLVLAGDENRVWTGEWRSDFQDILDQAQEVESKAERAEEPQPRMPGAFIDDDDDGDGQAEAKEIDDFDSEEESAPPEFDLRTGRYVSHTRPVPNRRAARATQNGGKCGKPSTAIAKRFNGELLAVKGIASPAAEFLAQKRTWKGLGSDFDIRYEDEEDQGGLVEEGRTGVARGYTVGDSHHS